MKFLCFGCFGCGVWSKFWIMLCCGRIVFGDIDLCWFGWGFGYGECIRCCFGYICGDLWIFGVMMFGSRVWCVGWEVFGVDGGWWRSFGDLSMRVWVYFYGGSYFRVMKGKVFRVFLVEMFVIFSSLMEVICIILLMFVVSIMML